MAGKPGQQPRMLVVGTATEDRFGDEPRPGGAVLYAARALAALGVRARVLTLAGPDAGLAALEDHEAAVVRARAPLRFEHEPEGDSRRLLLASRPDRALTANDLPDGWGDAEVLVLGPLLADDLDVTSLLALHAPFVALLAQGLQRAVGADGVVTQLPRPSEALEAACDARSSVFLSSEEVAAWPAGAVEALAERCARVVVTRGAAGATVHRAGAALLEIAAAPARAVDTTGGGDAFAASYVAALTCGATDAEAGALAAKVAAATVERVGPERLPRMAAAQASCGRVVAR